MPGDPPAALYQHLVAVARTERGLTTYAEVAPLAGLSVDDPAGRAELARLLDAINAAEHAEGRPMLSAVVVLKGTLQPGKGFFECARRLGRDVAAGGDDLGFWVAEHRRVCAYWRAQSEPR